MSVDMTTAEYEDYLRSFDESFADAPIPDRGAYATLPDGRYQVYVDTAEIRTNPNTGAMELAMRLKVLAGEHEGRIIFHQREIDNPERMSYLRGDLVTCGVQIDKLSDLPRRLNDLLDVKLDVQLKSKASKSDPSKVYQNCYLNKRLDDAGVTADDDRPF